jgi:hypothetical protein
MTQKLQNTAFPGDLFQAKVQGIDLPSQGAALASTKVPGRSLGIGLNGIAEYSTELPFLNFFQIEFRMDPPQCHHLVYWRIQPVES